jgi:hypothetical protein
MVYDRPQAIGTLHPPNLSPFTRLIVPIGPFKALHQFIH